MFEKGEKKSCRGHCDDDIGDPAFDSEEGIVRRIHFLRFGCGVQKRYAEFGLINLVKKEWVILKIY